MIKIQLILGRDLALLQDSKRASSYNKTYPHSMGIKGDDGPLLYIYLYRYIKKEFSGCFDLM